MTDLMKPGELAVKQAKQALRNPIFKTADDNIGRAISSAIYRMQNSEIARCFLRLVADTRTPVPASTDELRTALQTIAEGDEPRPIGKSWRADGQPSKHDKCIHDRWMYEDCGECVASFARDRLQSISAASINPEQVEESPSPR